MCDRGAIQWAESMFGDCIVTTRDRWSFGIGLVSTGLSLCSSVPQIVLNFRKKKVDGQSLFFFLLLFIGSSLNLCGVIITHGLVTQLSTGVCFVVLDAILLSQFIFYKYFVPSTDGTTGHKESSSGPVDQHGNAPLPGAVAVMMAHASAADYAAPYTGTQLVGTLFGWVGGAIFMSSRFPQISKDCHTKQVKDLSPIYLVLSILGNFTYCVAVMLKSVAADYLWKQAPFIVGCAGPMVCDAIVILQMFVYGSGKIDQVQEEESPTQPIAEL
jgi:uncharacterized protein with PQ loop repeat